MKIDIKTTEDNYTTLWLVLWQGALNLTPREREVLAAILDKYLELDKGGVTDPWIYKLCFDKDSRKEYCEKLSISSFNLTNLVAGLKEKGALIDMESDGSTLTKISLQLIPKKEITFRFVV
jgi:biotin operon repressor